MDYRRASDVTDYSSLANYDELSIEFTELEWAVDFEASVIKGKAVLTIASKCDSLAKAVFDTRDLKISSVTMSGAACKFSLGEPMGGFGQALVVTLSKPIAKGGSAKLEIAYATSPDSSALQWLGAEQTSGKARPYLFSQCQAIHARSMLPCVDAPGHKSAWKVRALCIKSIFAN